MFMTRRICIITTLTGILHDAQICLISRIRDYIAKINNMLLHVDIAQICFFYTYTSAVLLYLRNVYFNPHKTAANVAYLHASFAVWVRVD